MDRTEALSIAKGIIDDAIVYERQFYEKNPEDMGEHDAGEREMIDDAMEELADGLDQLEHDLLMWASIREIFHGEQPQ